MNNKTLIILLVVLIIINTYTLFKANIITTDNPLSISAINKASPRDRISPKNIHIYKDKAVISIDNIRFASIGSTKSMDPVLDDKTSVLEIIPKQETDIGIGDIISFQYNNQIVIHRVIKIIINNGKTYFITKGDNNKYPDKEPVAFESIKGVVIGILY